VADALASELYEAWRKALRDPFEVPAWGNAPTEARLAWEAAAGVARTTVQARCAAQLTSEVHERGALDAISLVSKQWSITL
jgi:hypothetical protein